MGRVRLGLATYLKGNNPSFSMTPTVMLLLLFLGLLVAAYRDIQIREVPDTVSYGIIVLGLLGGLLSAIVYRDPNLFINHLSGFGIGFGIGLFMYYTKQWGGGDAKLLMGVGSILGFSMENTTFIVFIILLILSGALYGILYTLGLAFVHRKVFTKHLTKFMRTKKVVKMRFTAIFSSVILFIGLFFIEWPGHFAVLFLIIAIYSVTYMWICTKVIETHILTKQYPVSKLVEGDWLIDDVKKGKKTIVKSLNTGLTVQQIKTLKKSKIKTVIVREGIPFVPSFLIAYCLLFLVLEWQSWLVSLIL